MPEFELKFIVEASTLTDAVVDVLGESEDVLCGGTGFGDSFVTITIAAPTARHAIADAHRRLRAQGLEVVCLQRDLVSGSEIAARTGQSRQGVHLWTTGKRRTGFPSPFDPVNALWLWGEVHSWALRNGVTVEDPDMTYPTREEHDWAGLALSGRGGDVGVPHRWTA